MTKERATCDGISTSGRPSTSVVQASNRDCSMNEGDGSIRSEPKGQLPKRESIPRRGFGRDGYLAQPLTKVGRHPTTPGRSLMASLVDCSTAHGEVTLNLKPQKRSISTGFTKVVPLCMVVTLADSDILAATAALATGPQGRAVFAHRRILRKRSTPLNSLQTRVSVRNSDKHLACLEKYSPR